MRFLLAATTMLFGSLGFAASAQAADVTSDPWLDSILRFQSETKNWA